MAETETLDNFLNEATFSPEAAIQDRIARFGILSRLEALAELELDAA